jgi:ribosome-associated protein
MQPSPPPKIAHTLIEPSHEDVLSKTKQKEQSQTIKNFGLYLTELPQAILEALSMNDVTLHALLGYKKMYSNLAKKRHLMFIGKCLRHENIFMIEEKIDDIYKKKQKPILPKKSDSILLSLEKIIHSLLSSSDQNIEQFLIEHPQLERQKLKQLIRHQRIKNKKTPNTSHEKLMSYLRLIVLK